MIYQYRVHAQLNALFLQRNAFFPWVPFVQIFMVINIFLKIFHWDLNLNYVMVNYMQNYKTPKIYIYF